MPVTGKAVFNQDERASWFSHKAETATPYYYKVYLADHDVVTEIAPTERAAAFRFTFPENDHSYVAVSYTHLDVYKRQAQDRTKGLLRTMVAPWQDNNHTNPQEWEPGWKKSDNWTKDRWTHYAFLLRDKGLPGFDTPTDVKCYSMIDGTRQGDPIRAVSYTHLCCIAGRAGFQVFMKRPYLQKM